MSHKTKITITIIVSAFIASIVFVLYPTGSKLLAMVRTHSYISVPTLPFEEDFNEDTTGWTKWGNLDFQNDGIHITSEKAATSTSSGIRLIGSQSWVDYAFNASLDWQSGETITLYAHYQDVDNREVCTFSKSTTRIVERMNGVQRQLFQGSALITDPVVNLGVRVIKDKIECLINGKVVAYAYGSNPILSSGGIGLSTGSGPRVATSITVHNISVSTVADDLKEYDQLYNVMASTLPTQDQSDTSGGVSQYAPVIIFPAASKATIAIASSTPSMESVPVLVYHGIVAKPDGTDVTTENFEAQMKTLKNAGWHSISIYDYYAFIQGKKRLPSNSFLITFDDGRRDSWVSADPILKKFGFQATMFAIMDRTDINQNFQLSLIDLQAMNASGRWQIQSHGYRDHDFYILDTKGTDGHFLSNKFWLAADNRFENAQEFKTRITDDLALAKTTLERDIKKPIIAFAYPFSDYGQDTANFPNAENIVLPTVQSIYGLAFYQVDPSHIYPFNYPNPGQFMQKRILIGANWTGYQLIRLLNANKVKNLPYTTNTFDTQSWMLNWGQDSIQNNLLDLSSSVSTNGALTYLSGSEVWSNYSMQASVNWVKGQTLALVARLKDDENFVECNFDNHSVQIVERDRGINTVLQESASPNGGSGNNYDFGIKVYGNEVACTVDNVIVVTALATSTESSVGNIGFSTWDAIPKNSEVIINSLQVTSLATSTILSATTTSE